jgi:hypothetical protein
MTNATFTSFKDNLLNTDFVDSQSDKATISKIDQIYSFAKTSKKALYQDVLDEMKLYEKIIENGGEKGPQDVTIELACRGFDPIKLTFVGENYIKGEMPTTLASDPHNFPEEQVYFDTDFILNGEILSLSYTYFSMPAEEKNEKENRENLLRISFMYDGKKVINFSQQQLVETINKRF